VSTVQVSCLETPVEKKRDKEGKKDKCAVGTNGYEEVNRKH
jgi:hypothetical protein